MRVRTGSTIALLLLLILPIEGISQSRRVTRTSDGESEHRLALIVGNDTYQVTPLRNAVNDARAVGGALRELGFDVTQLSDMNLQAFDRAVNDLSARIQPNDVVVFFYAGHGLQI